jgi:hypothetical protein
LPTPRAKQKVVRPILYSAANAAAVRSLDHDPIKLNRIVVWFFRWSMIFSGNRHPLFRIMLKVIEGAAGERGPFSRGSPQALAQYRLMSTRPNSPAPACRRSIQP